MSVYLTIAVSVERYISVVYPLISIRLHCHHSYLYLSLPAILFSIVFTLPNYFMLHTNCDQVSYFYFIHQLYLSEKSSCAINYFLSFAKYFSMIITTQGMKWTSLKRLDFSKECLFYAFFLNISFSRMSLSTATTSGSLSQPRRLNPDLCGHTGGEIMVS